MNINNFIHKDKILSFFNPLTPYGKIYKENLDYFKDLKIIERKLKSLEIALKFIKTQKIKSDKIKYHLKNIPYIDFNKENLDIADIFLYKKFLNNYFYICQTFTKKENDFFNTKWKTQELLNYLSLDSKSDDFYISDSYDENLKKIRFDISQISKEIDSKKNTFIKEIKNKTGLDFSIKDFLLIDSKSKVENSEFLFYEPYDLNYYLVKPKLPSPILELISKKELFIKEEKVLENKIKQQIIKKIKENREDIIYYTNAILEIDIAFASATMAIELNLNKPQISGEKIICNDGYFLPLKIELDKINIKYTPLTFNFNKRINIITGSNMGGKTIVLKTIAQLQFMAQCGFYVPAKEYNSPLFNNIVLNGYIEETTGLSSFAMEIMDLIDIISSKKGKTLIFMDEFAKTTNVTEAQIIFSAIIEKFSKDADYYLLAATHFSGIKAQKESDFLAMKGFNEEKFEKNKGYITSKKLIDKLKIINKCMDYELIRTGKQKKFYDAINIAKILGLDKEILENILHYLEVKNVKAEN